LLKAGQADGTDAILFESMVICEYLDETQDGAGLYPVDALSRARQRGWIEFGTATLADAWQFLNATDSPTADTKQAAFRDRLGQKQTHALQQAGLFDHLVGSQQYGGGHRSNVDGSASGAPQDVAGTTARDPVPAKSCPSYRQR
jgi:glutathione S-transferase